MVDKVDKVESNRAMADTRPRLEPLDGGAGPARPLTPDQARALVHRALGRLMAGDGNLIARRHPGRRLRQAGVALAALAVVGSALAAVRLAVRAPEPERPAAVTPRRAPAPAEAPLLEERAPRPARVPIRPRARSRIEAAPVEPAADGLARANQLRAQRQWREAARAYAAVATRAPGTQEAYVADLARAGLLLERLDRPAEALAIYRRARSAASWGPLRQEALYGEAACYQVLGNRTAERTALESFLAEFPATPLRAAVERRLAEMPAEIQ